MQSAERGKTTQTTCTTYNNAFLCLFNDVVMFNAIEHCKDNEQGLDKRTLVRYFNNVWYYLIRKQHEQQVQLDFIDDISESRQPRAIASYAFCPLFVMLIACYLPDLGAVATAAAPVLPPPMQSPTPAKYAFLCESNALFPVFWAEKRVGEGGFLLTKVNERADEKRRAGLWRAYLLGCNILSGSGLHGGWGLG